MERATLEDARVKVFSHKLAADIRETNLKTQAAKLEEREKRLAEQQIWELVVAQKRLEDLQASHAGEAQRVWNFLGQTDAALRPLSFSPVRTRLSTQEVGVVLPLLDSVGAKISRLMEAAGSQLEAKDRMLAQVVAEHMMMCFRSWDPQTTLEPVMQGPDEEPEEAAKTGVEEATRVVAERFERQSTYA
jgi:hypothetical protein